MERSPILQAKRLYHQLLAVGYASADEVGALRDVADRAVRMHEPPQRSAPTLLIGALLGAGIVVVTVGLEVLEKPTTPRMVPPLLVLLLIAKIYCWTAVIEDLRPTVRRTDRLLARLLQEILMDGYAWPHEVVRGVASSTIADRSAVMHASGKRLP